MTSPAYPSAPNLQPTYAPAPTSGVPSQAPVSTRFMPSFANANLARSLLMGSSNRNDPEVCQTYTCCGVDLGSMSNLLQHYESTHVALPQMNAQGLVPAPEPMTLDHNPLSSEYDSSGSDATNRSPPSKRRHLSSAIDPSLPPSAYLNQPGSSAPPGVGVDSRKRKNQSTEGGSSRSQKRASVDPSSLPSLPSAGAPLPAGSQPNPSGPVASSSTSSANNPLAPVPTTNNAPPTAPTTAKARATQKVKPIGPAQKTFHCPTPGCQKSYKQQNGLKYHLKVGQCNFEVRDAVKDGLSEAEAEEKSRPYVCLVGEGCTKRYRQMNGLRYHYLNSGAHGAIGMALIADGKHENPKSAAGSPLSAGSWIKGASPKDGPRESAGAGAGTESGSVAAGIPGHVVDGGAGVAQQQGPSEGSSAALGGQ